MAARTPKLPAKQTAAKPAARKRPIPARSTGAPAKTEPSGWARVIRSDADVAEGVRALVAVCPLAREMALNSGPLLLRLREPGFEGLARIVVSQQVSVASAAAIWARFSSRFQPMAAATILAASEEELRAAGLSRPKVRTLRAIAMAVTHEGLELDAFDTVPSEQVHAALTRVSGIGPWTADVFLMFCLGRADGFPPGDLALQEAAKMVMQLDVRPTAAELLEIAERWRPWRSVAARLLWAYYKIMKEREGIGS
jgi:DNA-3-methyladenine glycosylase II